MGAAVSPTDIVFSSEQQQALLGHAITSKKIFELAQAMGVTSAWFYSAKHQAIWVALETFVKQNQFRQPTLPELKSTSQFKNEEPKVIESRLKALDACLASVKDVDFNSIVTELREWAKGQEFVKQMVEADRLYTAKDIGKAYEIISKMNVDIERIGMLGLEARALYSSERSLMEREERVAQRGKIMHYGVSFLDEATAGIGSNDLVLIGAKTGVGKTQLVTRIAAFNAHGSKRQGKKGKRVTLFALEAENNEIERRLKFGLLATKYRAEFPFSRLPLNYRDWRRGAFLEELDPYEDGVNAFMDDRYSTLRTVYKGWGEYRIGELERDIMRMANDTDLFIIDHLHYIDTDGEDGNHEMKQIVKVLRDLALFLNKPIIVVAHMRKTFAGRKNAPLVPDLEDFHGSSDVIKIATTAIILSPCYDNFKMFRENGPDDFYEDPETRQKRLRLWATYARIAKCRLDGSVTRYCGLMFFNDATGYYVSPYGIGKLTSGDTAWEPEEAQYIPFWAKSASLTKELRATNE